MKNLEEKENEIKCTIDQLKEESKIQAENFVKQFAEKDEKIKFAVHIRKSHTLRAL